MKPGGLVAGRAKVPEKMPNWRINFFQLGKKFFPVGEKTGLI